MKIYSIPKHWKDCIIRIIRKTIHQIVRKWYLTPMLREEWENPVFKDINERPIEFGFALKCLSKICPTEVLDIGSGTTAWPHVMANCGFRVTAIDKIEGYWVSDFFNRHYYIINDDITKPEITKRFDLITCISVLEHIPDHEAAIKGIFKLLKPGGYVVLTVPYNEKKYVDNVYKLPDAGYGKNASYICQIFSRKEINMWLQENKGRIVDQEYYDVFTGDLWTFGKRIYPPRNVNYQNKHHLTSILIQKT